MAKAEVIARKLKRKTADYPEQGPAQIMQTDLAGVSSLILSHLPKRQNLVKSLRVHRYYDLLSNPTRRYAGNF